MLFELLIMASCYIMGTVHHDLRCKKCKHEVPKAVQSTLYDFEVEAAKMFHPAFRRDESDGAA